MENNLKENKNVYSKINNPNNLIYVDKFNYEIQNIEQSYILEHYTDINKRSNEIEKIIEEIKTMKKKNIIPDNLFWKKLHIISTQQGGFFSIKYRREIYPFILETLGKKPQYEIIPKDPTKKEIDTFDMIIENDCKRSVLYSIIKNNDKLSKYRSKSNYNTNNNSNYDINNSINSNGSVSTAVNSVDEEYESNQKIINIYLKELMSFTRESLGDYSYFNYFQGYQEICLYFMIIFGRKEGVKYMTLFGKIYLDYVLSKKYKINFDMLLDILNECCNIVNKKVNTMINKITKTKPYYSLSWLITYLTHSNNNLFNQLSLLDYFITSNISHIYFLSANIIVSEFNKIGTKFNINVEDEECKYMELFFQHFQNLKIGLINFQQIINSTEKMNHRLFNLVIKNTIKNVDNENDKGTLMLLSNNIHDNSIFVKYSVKKQILYIITFLIILYILFKYIR